MSRSAGVVATAAPTDKLAMSRALGAAFLNHQVEQLEKTVSNGAASGNWRERKPMPSSQQNPNSYQRSNPKPRIVSKNRSSARDRDASKTTPKLTADLKQEIEEKKEETDADVVVVDASVLVHALGQLKKWCKDGREEIVIIPLEALNTLDVLKKGTTSLAQRARAASRILEAQVGANPRIRVQRDDAFVLWDQIPFGDNGDAATQASLSSPEWLRRTICCARWETDNATPVSNAITEKPKVVLAIISQVPDPPSTCSPSSSPPTPSPVPLPLPSPSKHEPRSTGALVAQWARKAGITILAISPTAHGPSGSSDDDRVRRPNQARGARRNSNASAGRASDRERPTTGGAGGEKKARPGLVERPPAVIAMTAQPTKVIRVLARGEKLEP